MSNQQKLSAIDLQQKINSKQMTVTEVTQECLDRIHELNPILNAFLYIDEKDALQFAQQVDTMKVLPPLSGLPVAVPDVLDMMDTPTTFGSLVLQDHIAKMDAPEISQLKDAGATIVGKTNLAEFGLSVETTNKLRNPCINPLNSAYTPGGAAAGGAVAVASGMVPLALATDFHGALRISASSCGVSGLIPTRGRFRTIREHLLPFSERKFYRRGVLAQTVEEIELLYNALADQPVNLNKSSEKFKIAWSSHLDFLPLDPEVEQAMNRSVRLLKDAGHTVKQVKIGFDSDLLSHFRHIFAVDRYLLIMELMSKHKDRMQLLTPETRKWLKIGDRVTGVQYAIGQNYYHLVKKMVNRILNDYDFILTPTMPFPPYQVGKVPKSVEGVGLDPTLGIWSYAIPFNMSGHPVLVLKSGESKEGMPIGMQIVGRTFDEEGLLRFGLEWENL